MNLGDIEDSSADVSVNGTHYVGGLAGQNGDLINNSHAAGSVYGAQEVGGLVGKVFYDTSISDQKTMITNSYATGNVTGSLKVGGLIGQPVGHIENSYATGNVEGVDRVGGLIGEYSDQPSSDPWNLRRCYATGNVSPSLAASPEAEDGDFGGLIGLSQIVGIEFSYATGSVTGIVNAGGLVGRFNAGRIANSYATGSVATDGTGEDMTAGGLVGRIMPNASSSQVLNEIITSYAAGPVTGQDNADMGGLFGAVEGNGEEAPYINACYWDPDTTGLNEGIGAGGASGVSPLTTEDFDEISEFGNSWNFTGVWTIGEPPDGERRPILQWQDP